MEPVGSAALVALIKKIVDFFKYAANKDVNAVVTQLVSWVAGIAVAWLAANSDVVGGLEVNGTLLQNIDNWSVALLGVSLSSLAGITWDAIKAIDSTNSAVTPNLLGSTSAPQGQEGSGVPVHDIDLRS